MIRKNSIVELKIDDVLFSICTKSYVKSFVDLNESKHALSRHIEKKGVQMLIENQFGKNQNLNYLTSGKPILEHSNKYISISHSKKIIAFASGPYNLGIDIEEISDRILRLQDRFLNNSEKKLFGNSKTSLTLAWTIKESLFKIADNRKLSFKNELNILKEIEKHKIYLCSITNKGKEVKLKCRCIRFQNHFLTFNNNFE